MINLSEIKKKNICIMGLMGSGKSVVGKELSKFFELKFFSKAGLNSLIFLLSKFISFNFI